MTKLFQWEHITEDDYLVERRRITAALDELPADVSAAPSDDAIGLATNVGALWPEMTADEKRRFIDQWFDEIHIGRRAETMEVVPAERTKALVYASAAGSALTVRSRFIQRTRGDAGPPATRITVRGLDEWISWLETDDAFA